LEEPFLRYLMDKRGAAPAEQAALRIAMHTHSLQSDPVARVTLLDYVDAAIVEKRFDPAWRVWNLIGAPAIGRGFDWRLPANDGVYITRHGENWRVELSGREAEECDLLTRAIPASALLRYEYRTKGLTAADGITWQSLGEAKALNASPDWQSGQISLTAG